MKPHTPPNWIFLTFQLGKKFFPVEKINSTVCTKDSFVGPFLAVLGVKKNKFQLNLSLFRQNLSPFAKYCVLLSRISRKRVHYIFAQNRIPNQHLATRVTRAKTISCLELRISAGFIHKEIGVVLNLEYVWQLSALSLCARVGAD